MSEPLYERMRPRRLGDVLGQPKAVRLAQSFVTEGVGGRAYWLSSKKAGVGKSTIARLMAETLADPVNIYETIGSELTVDTLRDYGRWQSQFALGTRPGRAFVVDEAHTISRRGVEMLLKLLETGRIPRHVAWFFTTRRCGEARLFDDYDDADALLSRCELMALTDQGIAKAAAPRLREIVRLAGFPDGHDDRYYAKIVNDCGGSIRAAISEALNRARIVS